MSRSFAKSFYHSKEWEKVREYVLMRDKYKCVRCGRPAEEVHHIEHLSPANIGDVRVTLNPANLMSVCRECHFTIHKQDKIEGLKKRRASDCQEGYVFDENGYLVKVESE